jgi:hypothetical protein
MYYKGCYMTHEELLMQAGFDRPVFVHDWRVLDVHISETAKEIAK